MRTKNELLLPTIEQIKSGSIRLFQTGASIKALKEYKYIPNNHDDVNDHAADALRYALAANSITRYRGRRVWPYIVAGAIAGAVLAILAVIIIT